MSYLFTFLWTQQQVPWIKYNFVQFFLPGGECGHLFKTSRMNDSQNKRMSITHFITNCSICKIFMAHWIFTFGWTIGLTFILWSFIIVPESMNFSPLFPEACLWSGWFATPAVMIHFFLHHTRRYGPIFEAMEMKWNSCYYLRR